MIVTQSCLSLCNTIDCSLPGSSMRILQARILEWQSFPSQGDLLDPGIKLGSPTLQGVLQCLSHLGGPLMP